MKRFADVRRLLEVALLGGLVCAASEIYGAVPTAEARDEGLGRSSGVGSFQSPVSEDLRIVIRPIQPGADVLLTSSSEYNETSIGVGLARQ